MPPCMPSPPIDRCKCPRTNKRVERPWRVFSKRLTEETTETREKKKGKRERKTKDKRKDRIERIKVGNPDTAVHDPQ